MVMCKFRRSYLLKFGHVIKSGFQILNKLKVVQYTGDLNREYSNYGDIQIINFYVFACSNGLKTIYCVCLNTRKGPKRKMKGILM